MKIKQSTINLLIANLLTIGFALYYQWSLSTVLWVYWFQSVIIGIFHAAKIFSAKNFTLKGIEMNGEQLPDTRGGKGCLGFFFIIHYGLFHMVYAWFLYFFSSVFSLEVQNFSQIISAVSVATAIFFIEESINFIGYTKENRGKKISIGHMVGSPYKRIFPMHFFMIVGFGFFRETGAAGVVLFLLAKTFIDVFCENAFQKKQHNQVILNQ